MISPTSSGGTVRGLAEVGHALAPPEDPAVEAGVRVLIAGSGVGAILQMLCLGVAAVSNDSAIAALSLSGAALSSVSLFGLVVWLSRREAGRTSFVPQSLGVSPAPRAPEAEPARPTAAAFDRLAHDLNEVTTVVITHAELLRERRGGESYQLEAILEAGRRSAGLARELVALARQNCGKDLQQPTMKHEAFAVQTRKSEPPRAASEPPKGPGVVKAPSAVAASEPPRASAPPGSAGRDSVPLQSGRRVRSDQLNGARGVILLVDDEELLLKTTRRMLEQRGFRVVTAGDGAAAIEVALHTPDIRVLLTDLSLPGMDGRELARRLRWTLPELRVLFMSGFDAETSGLDAGQGGDAFLSKPFTARELEDRVSELFGSTDSDATAQRG